MEKKYEMVSMKNLLIMSGGKKRLVCNFTGQEFWKCIGCLLLAVTYSKKVHNLWIETPKQLVRIHQLNYKEMFVGPPI